MTGVLHVEDGLFVFEMRLHAAKMNFACDIRFILFPRRNQMFVNAVELVRLFAGFLQPIPLCHGGLDQRGRGVGIVFE